MALPASRRRSATVPHRPWRLLDLFMAALFLAVLFFFTLVLPRSATPSPPQAAASFPRPRDPTSIAGPVPLLEVCPKEAVDYVPCEDHRRFDGERHCPAQEEASVCLIPSPVGYLTPFVGRRASKRCGKPA